MQRRRGTRAGAQQRFVHAAPAHPLCTVFTFPRKPVHHHPIPPPPSSAAAAATNEPTRRPTGRASNSTRFATVRRAPLQSGILCTKALALSRRFFSRCTIVLLSSSRYHTVAVDCFCLPLLQVLVVLVSAQEVVGSKTQLRVQYWRLIVVFHRSCRRAKRKSATMTMHFVNDVTKFIYSSLKNETSRLRVCSLVP